jgi:hypothetical protein
MIRWITMLEQYLESRTVREQCVIIWNLGGYSVDSWPMFRQKERWFDCSPTMR